ncbi:MAG: sugar transferase [Ignavibacteria bacterium]|nr:sugar transferase [Ignavibacteria bacterium]
MKNNQKIKTSIYQRAIALLLFLLSLPILTIIALISFLDTKKNPIYIQERGLTLNKYRFRMIKFRTIRENSQKNSPVVKQSILKKTHLDKNVSSIGRFLRKTGIDELPQLVNIILGQMNFIGPRALSLEDLKKIKDIYPEYYERRENINSLPGILGLWQVNKDFECSVLKLIELDEEYERKKSLKLDLLILSKAFEIIFYGYHVDSIVNGKQLNVYPLYIYATLLSAILLVIFLINIL